MAKRASAKKPNAPKKTGRPSDYTDELAAELCARIADGKSLRTVCSAPDMPGKSTVMRWLVAPEHQGFRDQYARAREAAADKMAEEALEIADGIGRKEAADHGVVARDRLRVDTRKWFVSKLAPKKYGDRHMHELTGKDGGPIQTQDVSQLSDQELDTLEQLLAKLSGSGTAQS